MPIARWPQPFSSPDGIPDDQWNDSTAQWLNDQGRYDEVAPALGDDDPAPRFNPSSPNLADALGQAQMPHDQWQAMRAQQIAARDGDADAAPRLIPASFSSAQSVPSAGKKDVPGARAAADVIEDAARSVGRFFQRQAVGSNSEPATSSDPAVRWAQDKVGSSHYMRLSPADDARGRVASRVDGVGSPKCNQFVYDALSAAGAPPGRLDGGRIPVARDWGDTSSKIDGYAPASGRPRPGDVVSDGEHVGLYVPLPDGSPGTISAASPNLPMIGFHGSGGLSGGVVHNDWGFRPGQKVTMWRRAR